MERSQITRKFLTTGYQLSSDALDFFMKFPEKIEQFFQKVKLEAAPSVVTLDFLKVFLKEEQKIEKKITVDAYTKIFNKRFEAVKNMFSKRLDLVNLISINKISPRIKKFSLIGMVKEKNESKNNIIIEDNTGEIEIFLENGKHLEGIVCDEVLGVVCEKTGENISGFNIIFPDIPMRREIGKTKKDVYCFFISDLHMDSNLFKKKYYTSFIHWLEEQKMEMYIFVVGDISSNTEDVEKFLEDIPKIHKVQLISGEIDQSLRFSPSPFLFQVEDVNFFLFHNKKLDDYIKLWGTPDNAISNLVKKRHLDPVFSIESEIYERDPYLLDRIPDIIVAGHTHIPSSTNYKGLTILTTGSFISQPIFWLTNLRTREIFKVDFS